MKKLLGRIGKRIKGWAEAHPIGLMADILAVAWLLGLRFFCSPFWTTGPRALHHFDALVFWGIAGAALAFMLSVMAYKCRHEGWECVWR